MKVTVYNLKGETVRQAELDDKIFGRSWNSELVHQAFVTEEANRRKPIAHTKTRGEVSGGGKKPWRQKGTGRARHGSTRSPIWKGGGVTHGPRNDKEYGKKINKKMKKAALWSSLSKKLADAELQIVDSLALNQPKTQELHKALTVFFRKPARSKDLSVLLVPDFSNKNIYRASANIPTVKSLNPRSLNVTDVLSFKHVVIEESAIKDVK